ncbi:MAG: IPT/TIG domain-containing protein, partial [Acidobacteriota bacterium]
FASLAEALFDPTITVDRSGTIHIAYSFMEETGRRFGTPRFASLVLYSRSMDNGRTFTEPVSVTSSFTLADSPVLQANGNNTVVLLFAAFDNRVAFPSREIYLSRSLDNGASFSPVTAISRGNGDSTKVSAAIDPNGNVTVVWRDTQTVNYEIFISRLFAGEQFFTAPLNVSQNLGISESPSLAIDPRGNIMIAWEDETAGSNEIFFTRLTQVDLPLPSLSNFSPAQAAVGETIEVLGNNFKNVVDVKIGQLSTKITSATENRLLITVPNGAVTGTILVVTETGLTRSEKDLSITGKVNALPSRLDFGSTGLEQSVTRMLKITNNAAVTRKITGFTFNNAAFSAAAMTLPIILAPQASVEIAIVFQPKKLGLQTAALAVMTDDLAMGSALTIGLNGAGRDIQAPVVTIDTPMGGESFRPGNQVKIIWKAADNTAIATQQLLLSTDAGNTFPVVIASGLTGLRSFLWTVPNIDTRTARVRLVAIDVAGNRGEATTADFHIKADKKKRP